MNFDVVVPFLVTQAALVWPHYAFRFSVRYFIGKTDPFQITMTEDRGDRQGEMVFLQADAADEASALRLLVARFEQKVTDSWLKRSNEHAKTEEVYRKHMGAVEAARDELKRFVAEH